MATKKKTKPSDKLREAVNLLGEVDKSLEDIFELAGIVVDDIGDIVFSTDRAQFNKQKKDARKSLKKLKRAVDNMTFRKKS